MTSLVPSCNKSQYFITVYILRSKLCGRLSSASSLSIVLGNPESWPSVPFSPAPRWGLGMGAALHHLSDSSDFRRSPDKATQSTGSHRKAPWKHEGERSVWCLDGRTPLPPRSPSFLTRRNPEGIPQSAPQSWSFPSTTGGCISVAGGRFF